MSVGLRVLRGPDWPGDDERDGGEGHLGTVITVGGEGTCEVLWDNGITGLFRIGKFEKHDLRIFDNAPIGVRHSQVECDGCDSRDISGMLWKCAQCKKCNLCSLCYVTDKHDLAHEFIRYCTPDSPGEKLKRRSSSIKIRAMGLFPGATVVRGPDWNSGNMDGGSGKTGQITALINNSATPTTRNMVKVKWSSGQVGEHRVGHQGKVDLVYTEESPGTYYYKLHLPLLNSEKMHAETVKTRDIEVLQEGDKVCIQVPASSLKAMQAERSGWTSGMTNCIGKIGMIKSFTPTGDATVEFGGLRFRFFPQALKKVPHLNVGDVVKIQDDLEKVKMLQEGIGQGTQDLKLILGKHGKVVKVGEDGHVVVAFGQRTFILFSACCSLAKGQRVHEVEASKSNPGSPSTNSGVRHSQVECDGCDSRDISGMLWKCAQCKKCNLCSLCYVTDKHDLAHEFIRYCTPDSPGEKLKRRSSSIKIRAMGLFPGATVVRGPDWNSGNMDGGSGKTGQITALINNSATPTTRNMVKVKWSSGQVGEHRVGHQGKVDLVYTEESPGTYYYKLHLPLLNSEKMHAETVKTRDIEVLQEGDKVCIQVPASSLKAMQAERSGWTSGMTNCIGKIGMIKSFTPTGDATVEFGGLRFRFFPQALKKVPHLNVGDVVKIQDDLEKVKMLQEGIGQGTQDLKLILGKHGKVVKVGEDGHVVVAFGQRTFILFSACCSLAKGQRVHEVEASKSNPGSPSTNSDSAGVVHGDLLRMMAEVMMQACESDPDIMYHAIGKGDVSMVKRIASKTPAMVNKKHKNVTPLILAAHEGQTEVVRALLELGADTRATDGKGHTA